MRLNFSLTDTEPGSDDLAITHAHVGAAAQRLALAAGVGGKTVTGYKDGRSR